jgi:hypothetical protein
VSGVIKLESTAVDAALTKVVEREAKLNVKVIKPIKRVNAPKYK